jgi:hypothetical protein
VEARTCVLEKLVYYQLVMTLSPHFRHYFWLLPCCYSAAATPPGIRGASKLTRWWDAPSSNMKEVHYMKLLISGAVALFVLASPALANECPSLIQKAQEAMKAMPSMDDAMMKKVNDHIAQAQAEHDAGKHDEAVKTAKDALQLLGNM